MPNPVDSKVERSPHSDVVKWWLMSNCVDHVKGDEPISGLDTHIVVAFQHRQTLQGNAAKVLRRQ